MRKRYIQDPVTLQLIPAEEYYKPAINRSAAVIGDSIDGFMADATPDRPFIDSKSQLRRYCRDNGLTLAADCKGLPDLHATMPYDEKRARKEIGELIQRQLWR